MAFKLNCRDISPKKLHLLRKAVTKLLNDMQRRSFCGIVCDRADALKLMLKFNLCCAAVSAKQLKLVVQALDLAKADKSTNQ